MKTKGYWNKENVFKEAKKYSRKIEFKQNAPSAYASARKNKWLSEMDWFDEVIKPNGYWNKERVFEEGQKYKTKKEFQKSCGTVYQVAWKKGWLKEMDWFVDGRVKKYTDKNDSVYKYYWEETNTIYIGRTLMYRQNDRHNQHQADTDTVGKYAKENGLAIPPMEIIEENITPIEGLTREDFWVNYYKEKGYNVINKGKTGIGSGSLGAINFGKWNKKAVFEEAKKYSRKIEFQKGCGSAYIAAWKKGWLSEMIWFKEVCKPIGYWQNKENVFAEAKKYKTRYEFKQNAPSAYASARKNKWLSEMDWFEEGKKPNGYWQNKEIVFAEALKYSSKSEFCKRCRSAYYAAWKNKWLDILFPAKKVA